MKCPACSNVLTPRTVEDLVVDACSGGCGGLWFDQYELRKVDAKMERQGEELLDIKANPDTVIDRSAPRKCPKCEGMAMIRHFYSAKQEVEVDECPKCGGFWLDQGELRRIRDQYATDEERKKAAQEYFDDIFGVELEQMRKKNEEKARRLAQLFRFISPSYYIPGKQEWGNF